MAPPLIDRIRANGNAISEFDNYRKLRAVNPDYCVDVLRGYFGRRHGDWQMADTQARAGVEVLEAMGRRELRYREAYRAHQAEGQADDEAQAPLPA